MCHADLYESVLLYKTVQRTSYIISVGVMLMVSDPELTHPLPTF